MIHDIRIQACEFIKRPYIPLNSVRSFHLFYIFDGDGILIIDSSSYTCHTGELFLFPSVEIAIPRNATHSALTVIHISFTANSPNIMLELENLPSRLLPEARFRNLIMEILHEYTLKQPVYRDVCSFYLQQLLFPCIVKAKRGKETHFRHVFVNCTDDILTLACDYIEQNLTEDLSSVVLCNITQLNPRQLNHLFKSFYQLSSMEYVCLRRLSKAKELLHFSNYSVTQIAEYSGFKSVHYFSSFFKKKEGLTPSEYKKRVNDSVYGD